MKEGTPKELQQGELTAQQKSNPENSCLLRSILERLGDKWGTLIIGQLATGNTRFNALKRQIDGISQRMLTETLRKLERDGVVSRMVYPTNPPTVEYALTPLGQTLVPIIQELVDWAKFNSEDIREARQKYDLEQPFIIQKQLK